MHRPWVVTSTRSMSYLPEKTGLRLYLLYAAGSIDDCMSGTTTSSSTVRLHIWINKPVDEAEGKENYQWYRVQWSRWSHTRIPPPESKQTHLVFLTCNQCVGIGALVHHSECQQIIFQLNFIPLSPSEQCNEVRHLSSWDSINTSTSIPVRDIIHSYGTLQLHCSYDIWYMDILVYIAGISNVQRGYNYILCNIGRVQNVELYLFGFKIVRIPSSRLLHNVNL